MKPPSRKDRLLLGDLQGDVRHLYAERTTALRMFAAARTSTTRTAQTQFWFEFVWLDQEYRCAVIRLARFCEALDERSRRSSPPRGQGQAVSP